VRVDPGGPLVVASSYAHILSRVAELLFSDAALSDALDHQRSEIAELEALSEEHLAQVDAEAWAEALAAAYAVACPVLDRNGMWRETVKEVSVDVSHERRFFSNPRDAYQFPGYRVVVHVPFEGEADVFQFRPSTFTLSPPRAIARGHDVLVAVEYARDTQPDIDDEVNSVVASIEQMLSYASADIDAFNASLSRDALQAIVTRTQRIEQRDAHLAASSIPEGPPGERAKTEIIEAIVRRPAPALPDRPPRTQQAVDLEPALADDIYEHILGLIRSHATTMEQNPSTYGPMDEEERRTTILALLNSHYEGRAAAEAFNSQGKTDILIRWEVKNIFMSPKVSPTGRKRLS
jgi:hypothetical protein